MTISKRFALEKPKHEGKIYLISKIKYLNP